MKAALRRWWWVLAVVAILMQGCAPQPEPEEPDRLVLRPASFEDLPGWEADDQSAALQAVKRSCTVLEERADDAPLDIAPLGGRVGDWRAVCAGAATVEDGDSARAFFESHFTPYEARNNAQAQGLFTGYFEPELRGALQEDARYRVPLYRRPKDLVSVDLGQFRAALAGERIAGRVADGVLEPYATRAEIDTGALVEQGLELAWVDDPIDAFFLHIQGSGRITFEDGTVRRVAFAGTNGHDYVSIGWRLVDLGALSREDVSMQTIRDWLAANPERASEVMQANSSYVFFRWLEDEKAAEGPVGAQGVVLTAGRSLAVDRRFVPMTVPIWLEGTAPDPDPAREDRPLKRLMVAQDMGGAIRGPVRGDVYWGAGDEAGAVAGRMKHRGRYWLLLPRGLDVTAHLD